MSHLDQAGRPKGHAFASPLGARLRIERAIIPHVDDLAMCFGSGAAFLELEQEKAVTCGSVMVPCPWFPQVAEACLAQPSLDVGVHLTLTSEWPTYRWRPLSTTRPSSGLVDEDGFMWRDVASLRRHLVPAAAEAELRAQLDMAFRAGIRVTHIDAHMAAALCPELLDLHVRLGEEYRVVPVLPRHIRFAPDPDCYFRKIDWLVGKGRLLPDWCAGTLAVPAEQLEARWRARITELPTGVTHLALHCTMPGDFGMISPEHAPWRFQEYELLARGVLTELCRTSDIKLLGYRQVQALWWRE